MENKLQTTNTAIQKTPVNDTKRLLSNAGMKSMFEHAMQENTSSFIASIIDLYNSDTTLQKCNAKDVAMEALKAATLS